MGTHFPWGGTCCLLRSWGTRRLSAAKGQFRLVLGELLRSVSLPSPQGEAGIHTQAQALRGLKGSSRRGEQRALYAPRRASQTARTGGGSVSTPSWGDT